MDSMGGIEVPDILPEIKQIDVSDEEYQKIMNLFQPESSKREDSDIKFIYKEPSMDTMNPCVKYKYKQALEYLRCGTPNSMET